ncbi:hypothetical protein [Streptomyces flaveus]|uniref:Uncharacterized protein n=1 Tax=Streptomyces flaveus TaxID=66370 RepID=A0A917RDK0_9ACTN|nr:hypothetical protein [Streptomyces flaveus]GGL02846.1 hypothetical protein GCM10010094_74540 [Streptomyces flaveus]
MALLKVIDTNPSFAPRESGPLPERLISGNPAFKTWAQDVARGESIHTGTPLATACHGSSFPIATHPVL